MCACDDIHGYVNLSLSEAACCVFHFGMCCLLFWISMAVAAADGGANDFISFVTTIRISYVMCCVCCVHVSHKLGEGMSTSESNLTSQSWIARSQKRQNYVLHSFVTLCEANSIKIYLYLSHCLVALEIVCPTFALIPPGAHFRCERRIEMNLPKPVQENYYFI